MATRAIGVSLRWGRGAPDTAIVSENEIGRVFPMSFARRHRTAIMGAAGLAAGWVLASIILENLFGGSPLPWWIGVVIGAVYIGVGVLRGPPEERERKEK